MSEKEQPEVTLFREYLRIATVQPNVDYGPCIQWLQKQCTSIGLTSTVLEYVTGKPILVATWEGTSPRKSSILLNSHTDVVPVFPDKWTHEPFSAHKDDQGNIFARGSQDMKCVAIQHLEAVRRLKKSGQRFPRTIHISFVPDEEIGGYPGMAKWVKMKEFRALNVGFSLDEGIASPDASYRVFYGERIRHAFQIVFNGNPGHASGFIEDTAAEKLTTFLGFYQRFRDGEIRKLEENPELLPGDLTAINLTIINGGVQLNVVPDAITAQFDVRAAPSVDLDKFDQEVERWCKESGSNVKMSYLMCDKKVEPTSLDNKFAAAFLKALKSFNGGGVKIKTEIFPAATDSRYIREINIPAIGFSPMNHTPILLHDHNEYLNEKTFLEGIDVFEHLIPTLATLGGD